MKMFAGIVHIVFVLTAVQLSKASAPVFNPRDNIPGLITEGTTPGSNYTTFVATGGPPLTYSLDAKASEWFDINNATGVATVKKTIDREAMITGGNSVFRYRVYATNAINEKGSLTVDQEITDINDNEPEFTNLPKTIYLSEASAVGVKVYTVSATDKDILLNNRIAYTIVTGNEQGMFETDKVSGIITLKKKLDFEEEPKQYVLQINATNIGVQPTLFNTSTLTIQVNDFDDLGAKFSKTKYETTIVKFSAIGIKVIKVDARDRDSLNASVAYGIYPASNPDNLFAINNDTGLIRVARASLNTGLYSLIVTATSTNHEPAFSLVEVTVKSLLNISYSASAMEGPTDSVVLNLAPAEQHFNVTGGTFAITDGNQGSRFTVNGKELKIGSVALDRETKETYNLTITLFKNGTAKGIVVVSVNVRDSNDNKPLFHGLPYQVNLSEDTKIGVVIMTISATDADLNKTIKYAITDGNQQGYFTIDNSTGEITVAASLDRETADQYNMTITAYDGGIPPNTNTTTVTVNVLDVNDNSPVMNNATITTTLLENAPSGSEVATVTATDADIGVNGEITYEIKEGADGKFNIDAVSGSITTAGVLSYKIKPQYIILVVAKDHGASPRSGTVLVIVTLTAVGTNDNKPVFAKLAYLGGVYKDTSDDKLVLTVQASDADSDSHGDVEYVVVSGNADKLFYLVKHSGQLKIANSLSDKEGEAFTLKVRAQDKGSPPKVSQNNTTVKVVVLRISHSVILTAAVDRDFILDRFEEFRGILDALTGGTAFVKYVRAEEGKTNSTTIMVNAVNPDGQEMTYDNLNSEFNAKKNELETTYSKWKINHHRGYEEPETSARTSAEEGLSAVVVAMICLALLIGIGGIIMIAILIKKKRESERARKAARVTFNDKPHYIEPAGNSVSMNDKHIESAQEAQEVIVHFPEDSSSVESDEEQTEYINEGYQNNNDDDSDEDYNEEGDRVNFGTFFPPPPNQPPPPIPDSEAGDSLPSEVVSIESSDASDDESEYEVVLPPHEDFADDGLEHPDSSSLSGSTVQLVGGTYKDSLIHDPVFGLGPIIRSSNNEQTTEL